MFKFGAGVAVGVLIMLMFPVWLMVLVGLGAVGAWGYTEYKGLPAAKRRRQLP